MRRLLAAITATLFAWCILVPSAQAGYALPSPPAGWSVPSPGDFRMAAPANSASYGVGWRGAGAVVNVGGRSVTMPAAYRLAANAGRIAGRAFALTPARITIAVAVWLATQCVEYSGGTFQLTCGGGGAGDVSDGFEYDMGDGQTYSPSLATAAASKAEQLSTGATLWVLNGGSCYAFSYNAERCTYHGTRKSDGADWGDSIETIGKRPTTNCPAGWFVGNPCTQNPAPPPALTPDDVGDKMGGSPPPGVIWPDIPGGVPTGPPVLFPSPGDNPVPVPQVYPTGAPVPVPGTDPVQYTQPTVRIVPSPTPGDPWRVDIQPGDSVGTDPAGIPEGNPEPTDPAVPDDDLCKSNPNASACKPLDTPGQEALPTSTVNVAVTPDSGWGADNGTCPAKVHTGLAGDLDPFGLICTYMSGIRGLVIGFAWLIGTFIFLGRLD